MNSFLNKFSNIAMEDGKNFFFSPYSVHSAFKMVELGSSGKTKEEIANTFGGFPSLNVPKDFDMQEANSIWSKEAIANQYILKIKDALNAEARDLGNSGVPINEWVANVTKNVINSIVPEDLDKEIVAIIVNAIYFFGKWKYQFDQSETNEKDRFYTQSDYIKHPIMYSHDSSEKFLYLEEDNVKYLALPFKSSDYKKFNPHMVFILPDDSKSIRQILSEWNVSKFIEKSSYQKISVIGIPRFDFSWENPISGHLQNCGLNKIFSNDSEFNEILKSNESLKVSSVVHKAKIKVNEEGAECAAATAIFAVRSASLYIPKSFIANKPFAFTIVDLSSKTDLFAGAVFNPSQG